MRILIFAAYYLPHIGGYTLGTHEVAKGLVERGHEVEVVTCNTTNQEAAEVIDGVMVFRLPCWNLLGGQYPILKPCVLMFGLWLQHYDIVSTQTRFFFMSFIGTVFAKLKRIPHVHTERGAAHSAVSGKMIDMLGRFYDHTIGAFVVKMATVRVGVSEASCEFMRHLGGRDAVRIPNGVYDLFFDRVANGGRKTIVFAGRLVYGKGVQDLIYAFGEVRSRLPQTRLLIVGEGFYKGELEQMADGNGGIEFAGEKTPEELAAILSEASVFVHPSYSEGMPSSVMEASAVGLPVVATDVGGTRELVDDGRTGYLIDSGDTRDMAAKITHILSDGLSAGRMGKAGRGKMYAEYRWSAIINKYEELFKGFAQR